LMKLWNSLVKLLDQAGYGSDDYGQYCSKLINHLNEADPDGEHYRYPHGTKGQPFGFTKIAIEELVKAYWHVTTYAEASSDMLAELAPEDHP